MFKNKRISGVDECLIKQKLALESLGHKVQVYLSYTDLDDSNIIKYSSEIVSKENINLNHNKEFPKIVRKLIEISKKFKPDIILSNYSFIGSFYNTLQSLGVPIYYLCHTSPGSFSDLVGCPFLHDMLKNGHSLGAVSNYQKDLIEKYYKIKRKSFKRGSNILYGDIEYNIAVDHVTAPTFAIRQQIIEAKQNTIRHVSVANKEKKTFLIHEFTKDLFFSEVFTTTNYVGASREAISYLEINLEKYKDCNTCKTYIDIDHSQIIDRLKDSTSVFVGLAPYDSFTITSIEALQFGIPLILYGKNGYHPALEFVSKEFLKYVYVYSKRDDFITKLEEFNKMTLDERKLLAQNCVENMSFDKFKLNYENALNSTIKKYYSISRNSLFN